MPKPTEYIYNVTDTIKEVSGNTAPATGYYYSQIYSSNDATAVPTLNVTISESAQQMPVSITNLTDMQILEMIQSGQTVRYENARNESPTRITEYDTRAQDITKTQFQERKSEYVQGNEVLDNTEVPVVGIFMLLLLLCFVGFVYFIIRVWQDHQAQKRVMSRINKKESNIHDVTTEQHTKSNTTDDISNIIVDNKQQTNTESWRMQMEQAEQKLLKLLEDKHIPGDSISEKLKSLKSGQFALADIAWEAQNSAKRLLSAHDSEVTDSDIKRTLQLFKQVFVEHGVV